MADAAMGDRRAVRVGLGGAQGLAEESDAMGHDSSHVGGGRGVEEIDEEVAVGRILSDLGDSRLRGEGDVLPAFIEAELVDNVLGVDVQGDSKIEGNTPVKDAVAVAETRYVRLDVSQGRDGFPELGDERGDFFWGRCCEFKV